MITFDPDKPRCPRCRVVSYETSRAGYKICTVCACIYIRDPDGTRRRMKPDEVARMREIDTKCGGAGKAKYDRIVARLRG